LSLLRRFGRDVFLAKPVHANDACDWHVDDQSFWPAKFASDATAETGKDQHGVNVWLALDDMPADCAGSMAVAPGSHRASWKEQAYKAIGQDRSADKDWTQKEVAAVFANLRKGGTCNIGQTDASLREQIESTGVVLDVKRGDAVFCTRLLFHRTLDVTEKGKLFYTKPSLNRYSLRYVPGSARVPGKYNCLEWSVLLNPEMAGRSLDEIVIEEAHCWYPRVWPRPENEIEKRLDDVAATALKAAKVITDEERSALLALSRAIKEKQEADATASAEQSTPEEG
jgi:Phytanoyl-CoA dioxygenase (PhyH)